MFHGFFKLFRSPVKQEQTEITKPKPVSLAIGKGIIEVEKGDITKQMVITLFSEFERLFLFSLG